MADPLSPDVRLVAAFQAGDRTAFDLLLARHQGGVTEYTFSLAGDLGQAEEIAREAFIEAFRNLHRLRQNSSLGNWVLALARTAWRARRVAQGGAAAAGAPGPAPGEGDRRAPPFPINAERARSIGQALGSIPKSFRETVVYRHLNRLSPAEIARIRSETAGAIAQRLARAHAMLRALAGGPVQPGEGIEPPAAGRPCGRRRDRLPLLATGDLEPGERAPLEEHLGACEACRRDLARTRRFLAELEAYLGVFAARPPLLRTPPRERWGLGVAVAAAIVGLAGLLFWQAFSPSGILAGQPRAIPLGIEIVVSRGSLSLVRDRRLLLDLRPGRNEIALRDLAQGIEPGSARVAIDGERVGIEEGPEEGRMWIAVEAGSASRREAELAYLLRGLSWSAEYEIAVREGDRIDLAGWAVLRNQAGFARERARLRLLSCRSEEPAEEILRETLLALGEGEAAAPEGFDVRTFRTPLRLRPGESRLSIARARGLPFVRVIRLDAGGDGPAEPRTTARIRSDGAEQLDLPLPSGVARILDGADPPLRTGELVAAPDGEGIDISIGAAPGIRASVEPAQGPPEPQSLGRAIHATNARREPVEIEVRVPIPAGWVAAQAPPGAQIRAGALLFLLAIEARGEARAEWRLRGS